MPTTNSGFMIQGTYGAVGNLELVVPSRYGGLVHCWRDNNSPGFPWTGPSSFGSGDVAAASLIESSIGGPGATAGPLEVVAREGSRLVHYLRGAQFPYPWLGPVYL